MAPDARRTADTLPALIAVVLSLAIHAGVLLGVTASPSGASSDRVLPPPESEDLIEPGDAEPSPARVAWISYESYRELMARESVTEQPAVQATAPPRPDAPAELDPSATSPGEPAAAAAPTPPAQASEATPEAQPTRESAEDTEITGETERFLAGGPLVPEQPVSPPQPQVQPSPSGAERVAEDRPTSTPQDTREAPPTALEGQLRVEPGRVLAREGLIIDTVVPRYTIAARTTLPRRNPIVRITFGVDGKPTEVHWVRTSGLAIHDGPLERALYLWRARGPLIEDVSEPRTVEIRILLLREPGEDDEEPE